MIIFDKLEKKSEKLLDELKVGDILKRKSDGCFYELNNITEHPGTHNFVYSFYGFAVKMSKNLRMHFETNNNLFVIY